MCLARPILWKLTNTERVYCLTAFFLKLTGPGGICQSARTTRCLQQIFSQVSRKSRKVVAIPR